jgi:hypothetical protein
MSRKFITTAKELAFKAYCDAHRENGNTLFLANEDLVKAHFEIWWSANYGNKYATTFYTEHNVFIENRRYIQAE